MSVYAGVKSYSIKGKMLTRKDLQMLSESRDLDELITRLKATSYGEAISKVTRPYSSAKIEMALRERQADLHFKMIQAAGGSNVLFAYYLRFILQNLKIILKGKILGRSQAEIELAVNLHATELIRERDTIVKALIAKDVEEAVATLKIIGIGNEVEKAFSLYHDKKQIQILDLYFDKFFYDNLNRVVKSSTEIKLHTLCGTEIDYHNMMCVLRGKFWNLDENQIQDLIVPGASISTKEVLSRMVSADSIKSALNELVSTKYGSLVPQEENAIDAISQFERAFEMRIYNLMQSQFGKMFGFSTVVAIVRLIEYEIRNLASIAFAVEQKIPPETTMSRLIVKESAD
ncbi:MAG TPA: V-type ATPase subunit [Candidatus Nitrosotenuis sp.]|nr:V-type ATPase subunit [Candidatus Nitrosotenuis sp.]